MNNKKVVLTSKKATETILNSIPYTDSYEYCEGGSLDRFSVFAICKDGTEIPLDEEISDRCASRHTPDRYSNAETVAVQLAELKKTGHEVYALKIEREYRCSWENTEEGFSIHPEEWERGYIPFSPNHGGVYEFIVPLNIKVDTKKLRRRIEDRLRKDTKAVFLAANAIGLDDFPLTDIEE